ncbi:MAG: DUF932 domain-containing protein [Chloroflexi bacterium]|nr:DUF932 domain-containing protein [Chloroflexota bacterium]
MAHELEVVNGEASMIYAAGGGTPWHRLGTPIEDGDPARHSVERALMLAQMGFEVELWPLEAVGPDGERRACDHRATVRVDTGEVLGVVGADYQPVQQAQAFAPMQPLLDSGVARIETAGVLRGGRDVWMLVRFDDAAFEFGAFEGTEPYGLIANNHTGKRALDLALTRVRVVCANTLGAVQRGETTKIHHVGNVAERVQEEAERIFEGARRRYAALALEFDRLQQTQITSADFRRLVLDVAVPLKRDPETDRITSPRQTLERREAIQQAWEGGIEHGGPSAWWAYNGLVEVLDHSPLYNGKATSRVESMMRGPIAEAKGRVYDALLEHARG